MLYTPSHAELAQHPKTRKLARSLGVSIPTALGHLHLLWHFALKYAPDGNLARFDAEEIADGCMWEGDATAFSTALSIAGWIDVADDADMVIHDWEEQGGKLLHRKEANAQRMRETRANNKQDTKKKRAKNVQRTNDARVEPEESRGEESREEKSSTVGTGAGAPPNSDAKAPIPIKRADRATRIPAEFPLTDRMRRWAAERVPDLDLGEAHEEFCAYWRGKGGTNVDWYATWQHGMLRTNKMRREHSAPRYISQAELNKGVRGKFVGA